MAEEQNIFNINDIINFANADDETDFIQRLQQRGVRPEDYVEFEENILGFDEVMRADLENIEVDLLQAQQEGNQQRLLELQNEQANFLNAQRAIDRVANYLNTIITSGYYLATPPQSRRPTGGGANITPLTPPQQPIVEPPPLDLLSLEPTPQRSLSSYDIRNQPYSQDLIDRYRKTFP